MAEMKFPKLFVVKFVKIVFFCQISNCPKILLELNEGFPKNKLLPILSEHFPGLTEYGAPGCVRVGPISHSTLQC